MEYILKENGNVYLVKEHDVYGKNKTYTFLGKEYVEEKPKKTKKEDEK